jgi:rhamnogalacturonan endolyase
MRGCNFGSLLALAALVAPAIAVDPFFVQLGAQSWLIGNEIWNLTQGPTYGVKLWYKGRDCVGRASGHYASACTSICNYPMSA